MRNISLQEPVSILSPQNISFVKEMQEFPMRFLYFIELAILDIRPLPDIAI